MTDQNTGEITFHWSTPRPTGLALVERIRVAHRQNAAAGAVPIMQKPHQYGCQTCKAVDGLEHENGSCFHCNSDDWVALILLT